MMSKSINKRENIIIYLYYKHMLRNALWFKSIIKKNSQFISIKVSQKHNKNCIHWNLKVSINIQYTKRFSFILLVAV